MRLLNSRTGRVQCLLQGAQAYDPVVSLLPAEPRNSLQANERGHEMNTRVNIIWLGVTLLASMVVGCSTAGDSVLGPTAATDLSGHRASRLGSSRVVWGVYEIGIDTRSLEVTVEPSRTAEFNANVTMFMQKPISPTSCITVSIDPFSSDIPEGLFAVDITLHHPFPGIPMYSGFDVRGIFMSDGSVLSDHYSNLLYAADDEARLLNADGWTRWWNPTEFTTYNTIFGYTQGALASPGFTATATLNPYKYFADGLESEDELAIDPASRGFFATSPGVNERRYMIQFPMNAGSPVVEFNYAVDASWDNPAGDGPIYLPEDYSLSANCQEAYMLAVADAGSDAWYVSPTENGGDLVLDITVYDWQAVENPLGVPGEVAAIWVESPDLLDAPVDVLPTAVVSPDGPTSSVFHVEIADVTPSGLTGQTLMVAVESESPSDYAPNIDGISGFDYPEEPLAAFLFWDAPILTEEPVSIPTPTGLDNCAAAGVVHLFWDPVDWPTLAGYNVYRKLSTAPGFDFLDPLNPTILTETDYIDTAVLMTGTTYDYVVKAVDIDATESDASAMTSATPVYIAPKGFTDLENPDGQMGNVGASNFVNSFVTPDGTIYLVYALPTRFVRSSMTNPTSFQEVSLAAYAYGEVADVAPDSQGNAHIVWTNYYNTSRACYYAMVTPGNAVQNFTTIHTFTSPNGWEGESTIAVTPDDEIHIVMPSYDGTYKLVYVHGQPGNLSAPVDLTTQVNPDIYHMRPDMVADRFGNLHLVWTGPSASTIMYMKRNASGTWGSVEVASSGVSGYPNFAAVAVDYLGAVHVAWCATMTQAAYTNNRSGSWQGKIIPGSLSSNVTGIACDRDGNAYVDYWHSITPTSWRTYVALIDRNSNVVETGPVNDDQPYQGTWCSFAGITDPCWDSDTSTIAFWRGYPFPPQPFYGRIQTDY